MLNNPTQCTEFKDFDPFIPAKMTSLKSLSSFPVTTIKDQWATPEGDLRSAPNSFNYFDEDVYSILEE